MPKKIPLTLKFYDKVIVFFHKEQNRALSTAQQERESLLGELTKLYYNAITNQDPLELLELEHHSINAEYAHIELSKLDENIKISRLKPLDEALIQLRNSFRDLHLILNDPKKYAQGVQEAYGPHRKIVDPPSGDTVRKFALNQAQRLGRMNQGLRSEQEVAFFGVRQLALKTLGQIYCRLQCQALGLAPKRGQEKGNTASLEHEGR